MFYCEIRGKCEKGALAPSDVKKLFNKNKNLTRLMVIKTAFLGCHQQRLTRLVLI